MTGYHRMMYHVQLMMSQSCRSILMRALKGRGRPSDVQRRGSLNSAIAVPTGSTPCPALLRAAPISAKTWGPGDQSRGIKSYRFSLNSIDAMTQP